MLFFKAIFLVFIFLLNIGGLFAESDPPAAQEIGRKRVINYHYGYLDRHHTRSETLNHLGGLYLLSWAIYPLSQPKVFKNQGSFKNYGRNFGRVVFDRDEPFWNWFVHPLTGSQLFLYYRANGYSRVNSLGLAFISSALFEFTVEVYSEPASVQDLFQTPVIGSVIGLGLENLSMYLLNTGNVFGKFFGHAINPSTLFWFYEGKVNILPRYDLKEKGSLTLVIDF